MSDAKVSGKGVQKTDYESSKANTDDGYIVRGLGELQKSVGTDLILKNCTVFSCNQKNL